MSSPCRVRHDRASVTKKGNLPGGNTTGKMESFSQENSSTPPHPSIPALSGPEPVFCSIYMPHLPCAANTQVLVRLRQAWTANHPIPIFETRSQEHQQHKLTCPEQPNNIWHCSSRPAPNQEQVCRKHLSPPPITPLSLSLALSTGCPSRGNKSVNY